MVTQILKNVLEEIIKNLNYETEVKISRSNRPDLCDYQYDGVFKLASFYKKSPIEIGEEIVLNIN